MEHHTHHPAVQQHWLARLYFWFAERTYREFAWTYDAVTWSISLGRIATWRRDVLDHVRGQRVLEVGFGTGELLSELAQRGLDVYGLERSAEMHRVTAAKLGSRGLDALRVQGVVQRLPFANARFDTIISTFPTSFIFEPAVLAEFARVLQPADTSTQTPRGRLIVVGIGLTANSPPVRRVLHVLFGGSSEDILANYQRIATAAGFTLTMLPPGHGWIGMSVIVADKC